MQIKTLHLKCIYCSSLYTIPKIINSGLPLQRYGSGRKSVMDRLTERRTESIKTIHHHPEVTIWNCLSLGTHSVQQFSVSLVPIALRVFILYSSLVFKIKDHGDIDHSDPLTLKLSILSYFKVCIVVINPVEVGTSIPKKNFFILEWSCIFYSMSWWPWPLP